MAKQKWYTALVNLTTKEITFAQEWDDEEAAKHQDSLNELGAAMNHAGLGADPSGKPYPAGDDWQAYGPESEPFSFDIVSESA